MKTFNNLVTLLAAPAVLCSTTLAFAQTAKVPGSINGA